MNGLTQDLRFAWRMLVKNPGFTAAVVIAMGLGIGANASIFTIVRGIMLRELPFDEPARVVAIESISRKNMADGPFEISPLDYLDYRERAKSFEHLGVYTEIQAYLTLASEPERFNSCFVTPEVFPTLGVRPQMGRNFLPEEGVEGKQFTSVIVSHRIWTTRMNADPGILGQTLKMNGRVRTVVGVMPEDFRFPEIADFWIPIAFDPKDEDRGAHYLDMVGRLGPGVSVEQARAEVSSIAKILAKEHPLTNDGIDATVTPYGEALVRDIRPAMVMLMSAVAFVLLIACANIANLMLARAATRQRELGLRVALGAGRGRLARQLLTESILIALLGGTLGVLIAYWANDLVLSSIPVELPYWMKFEIDGGILLFTLAISTLCGIVFGLAPVLQISSHKLYETLKEGSLQGGIGRAHHRMRNGLVVAEVALAMVLLIGSGLMIRSFVRMQEIRGGFDPDNVLIGRVTLPVAVYKEDADRRRFFQELLPRVRELPGVIAASASSTPPLGSDGWSSGIVLEGHEQDGPAKWPVANFAVVMPEYLTTLRIPLRSGRDFAATDGPDAPRVVLINQAAATLLWPEGEPLGKRMKVGIGDTLWSTVVGVTGNVRQTAKNLRVAQIYVPHSQHSHQTLTLIVRTSGAPAALTTPIRTLLQTRDPDLPFYQVSSLRESMRKALWDQRLYAWLMGVYSLVALVIAAIGIYGVMAYRVAQRTQEIGIRMALGAPQGAVLRMVVGQGLRLTVLGLGIGLAAAFAVTRLMASLLFGVDPNDPPTFAGVAAILALSAMIATFLPAWRASRVDPMTALRHE